jgi:hypothetical protein
MALLPALAHLLHVLLNLRALRRRKHVQHLLAQLLVRLTACLRVHPGAARMRLAELLHDLLELRFLLIAQIYAAKHAHEAVPSAVAVALPLAVPGLGGALRRRLPGLLRKHRDGGNQSAAQRGGKKKGTKGFHWVFNSVVKRLLSI